MKKIEIKEATPTTIDDIVRKIKGEMRAKGQGFSEYYLEFDDESYRSLNVFRRENGFDLTRDRFMGLFFVHV